MIIRRKAYARGGLIGNPSDGYYGKTIALSFRNFFAEATLYESPELAILPAQRDHSVFESAEHLVRDVRAFGYYGGIRLLKAAIKRFYEYCTEQDIALHQKNFTIRYTSNIPNLVGLAGSSAIITATIRALKTFYNVSIPRPIEANLILSVETDELGISAGLQDRVAQVYQGLVYMDFDRKHMEKRGYGHYEALDPRLLPKLYIAYREDLSEGSDVMHNDLRLRFLKGDRGVLDAIEFWKDLTVQVREILLKGEGEAIGPLLDANFDRRAALYQISDGNLRMVEAARAAGASAKFTGSGGAIIGTYEDEPMFRALRDNLEPMAIRVFRPEIVPAEGGQEHEA